MEWMDRTKTVHLTDQLEKAGASRCPVCGDQPMIAFVAKERIATRLTMYSRDTGEAVYHMLFDVVMCSKCGHSRLHQHGMLQEWLGEPLENQEESDQNEHT